MTPLRLVFAGTPDFAAIHLNSLLDSAHSPLAVYTQPDRPSGRGRRLSPSPVKAQALEAGLPIFQPQRLDSTEARQQLQALAPDLLVVVAYGLILPKAILELPRLGCINVHASLLPRWRGAAPIQRALLAGDAETGISLMQMDEGLDTGDILLQHSLPIDPRDSSASLHQRLAELGALSLIEGLDRLVANGLRPCPQTETQASYAAKLRKEEGNLNWDLPAETLERQIRAFNPWPVAWSELQGQRIRIWEARPSTSLLSGAAGTILAADSTGIEVATGAGSLIVTRLQLPGGKQLSPAALLNARHDLFVPGRCFDRAGVPSQP